MPSLPHLSPYYPPPRLTILLAGGLAQRAPRCPTGGTHPKRKGCHRRLSPAAKNINAAGAFISLIQTRCIITFCRWTASHELRETLQIPKRKGLRIVHETCAVICRRPDEVSELPAPAVQYWAVQYCAAAPNRNVVCIRHSRRCNFGLIASADFN